MLGLISSYVGGAGLKHSQGCSFASSTIGFIPLVDVLCAQNVFEGLITLIQSKIPDYSRSFLLSMICRTPKILSSDSYCDLGHLVVHALNFLRRRVLTNFISLTSEVFVALNFLTSLKLVL